MSDILNLDLYELTMAAAYLKAGYNPLATFELFARRLPAGRGYLVAAGLGQALEYLAGLRFSNRDIGYLREVPALASMGDDFFSFLSRLRFSGEVWAVPEGSLVFPGEPLLRVSAPLVEAQIVETRLLASLQLQTLVASKATRVVQAAAGRPVYDFGSRRAHGPEAGPWAARAAWLAGCQGTSNCLAGQRFGVPVAGTMAHSFVMAHSGEAEAFACYLDCFPRGATLLVDTYDTLAGVRLAAGLGPGVSAVRLDSGDLLRLSRRARQILDEAGRSDVRIFASGNLNEHRIARLLEQRAPIDAFGVGTEMVVSADAPSLDLVYKLVQVESDSGPRFPAKKSSHKSTLGGCKQVWRVLDKRGRLLHDTLALEHEAVAGEPLLHPVMQRGRVLAKALEPLERCRRWLAGQLERLPPRYRRLRQPAVFPVHLSADFQRQAGANRPG